MNEEIYTIDETRSILKVGKTTMYKLLNEKNIEGFKIGREWRVTKSSIEKFCRKKIEENEK